MRGFPAFSATKLDALSLHGLERYLAIDQTIKPRIPVGSPYGFTYLEWEVVSSRKANKIEELKKILREHGYSEKAIEAILKWYM